MRKYIAILLVAMWVVVGVSINATRETEMAHVCNEANNLAAAFSDEVTHILDGVSAEMEVVDGSTTRLGDGRRRDLASGPALVHSDYDIHTKPNQSEPAFWKSSRPRWYRGPIRYLDPSRRGGRTRSLRESAD